MQKSASEKEYLRRIHKAQDYIEKHLGDSLTLEEIAREGCFSPYHFHRVFSAISGETLYQFILRLRLEKAATQLLQYPDRSISTIAYDLGFSSSSVFARSFKEAFQMSARDFRKNCKTQSNPGQDDPQANSYLHDMVQRLQNSRRMTMSTVEAQSIEVRDLPAKTLAYLRHVGPYAGDDNLFERLWGQFMAWAGPRGILGPQSECMTIYHDNPEITEQEKLRISLGCTVPPHTETSGEINLLDIPEGRYVCARFEIHPSDYGAAWNTVMTEWLPQNGWEPSDAPAYECYLNDPKTHPEGKHIFEIRLGVQPLS